VPMAWRATRKLLDITRGITDQKFARTKEGDRTIVWPESVDIRKLVPFRGAPLSARDHADIPLAELASLAFRFLAVGSTPEETTVLMSRQLGLGRILSRPACVSWRRLNWLSATFPHSSVCMLGAS
jgi:hypothetical protein